MVVISISVQRSAIALLQKVLMSVHVIRHILPPKASVASTFSLFDGTEIQWSFLICDRALF